MNRKQKRLIVALMTVGMIGGAVAAGKNERGHHHHFPADVDAFHQVLAPVWHAARGAERDRDACSKAGRMEQLAKDIHSSDASRLQASIAVLVKKCQGSQGEVEAALFDVHEEFHHLIRH